MSKDFKEIFGWMAILSAIFLIFLWSLSIAPSKADSPNSNAILVEEYTSFHSFKNAVYQRTREGYKVDHFGKSHSGLTWEYTVIYSK